MVFIESFKDGDAISGIYFCRTKSKALTKAGKEYFNLNLQDKSGSIDGKIWSVTSPSIKDFEQNSFVKVVGEVSLYNNNKQLIITSVEEAKEGQYNPKDYFVTSKRNLDEMKKELSDFIASISKPYYKELLAKVFGNQEFYNEFVIHAGAKQVHHAFVSGLLEHTLSVAKLCDAACATYGEIVDRDLLISAALCHDIGKVYETSSDISRDMTREGMLIGHIIQGYDILSSKIKEIASFPKKSADDFLHCILSHHGRLEFGSPKAPMTLEAEILSSEDKLDADIEIMKEDLEKQSQKNNEAIAGPFNKFLESNYVIRTSSDTK